MIHLSHLPEGGLGFRAVVVSARQQTSADHSVVTVGCGEPTQLIELAVPRTGPITQPGDMITVTVASA